MAISIQYYTSILLHSCYCSLLFVYSRQVGSTLKRKEAILVCHHSTYHSWSMLSIATMQPGPWPMLWTRPLMVDIHGVAIAKNLFSPKQYNWRCFVPRCSMHPMPSSCKTTEKLCKAWEYFSVIRKDSHGNFTLSTALQLLSSSVYSLLILSAVHCALAAGELQLQPLVNHKP